MSDVVVDRLRIRGTGTRRLATVAARALPGALERALSDLADADLGRLTVRLTDPDGHDDATLAVLWADAIRQAALAAGARPRARGPVATAGAAHRDPDREPGGPAPADLPGTAVGGTAGAATADAIAAAVSQWLARRESGPAPVPSAVAALSDPRVAAAVLGRIGAGRAESLAVALAAAAGQPRTSRDGPGTPAAGPASRSGHRTAGPDGITPGPDAVSPATPAVPATPADRVAAAARAIRPVLELGGTAVVDLTATTRAAGIVLAYPWLAGLCRHAVDLHPTAEPSHPRRVALAALADPRDPGLADDALVRLLAGTPADAAPDAGLAPLDDLAGIRAAAEEVVHRFAALLPGFERSSAGFVRDMWLLRPGLLDLTLRPVTLVARTAPLDVVLPSLPYPVGVLRLPWTPVLTVRFRP